MACGCSDGLRDASSSGDVETNGSSEARIPSAFASTEPRADKKASEPDWIFVDGRIVDLDDYRIRAETADVRAAPLPPIAKKTPSMAKLHVLETLRDESTLYVATTSHCEEPATGRSACFEAGFQSERVWTAFDAQTGTQRWTATHMAGPFDAPGSVLVGDSILPVGSRQSIRIAKDTGRIESLGSFDARPLSPVAGETWLVRDDAIERIRDTTPSSRSIVRLPSHTALETFGTKIALVDPDRELVVIDPDMKMEIARHRPQLTDSTTTLSASATGKHLCAAEERRVSPVARIEEYAIRCLDDSGRVTFSQRWVPKVAERPVLSRDRSRPFSPLETFIDKSPCEVGRSHWVLCSPSPFDPTPKTSVVSIADGRTVVDVTGRARILEDEKGRLVGLVRLVGDDQFDVLAPNGNVLSTVKAGRDRPGTIARLVGGKIVVIRFRDAMVATDAARGTVDARVFVLEPTTGEVVFERDVTAPAGQAPADFLPWDFEVRERKGDLLLLVHGATRAWFVAMDLTTGKLRSRVDGLGYGPSRLYAF